MARAIAKKEEIEAKRRKLREKIRGESKVVKVMSGVKKGFQIMGKGFDVIVPPEAQKRIRKQGVVGGGFSVIGGAPKQTTQKIGKFDIFGGNFGQPTSKKRKKARLTKFDVLGL